MVILIIHPFGLMARPGLFPFISVSFKNGILGLAFWLGVRGLQIKRGLLGWGLSRSRLLFSVYFFISGFREERKGRKEESVGYFFLRTKQTQPLRNCFSDLQEQAL